MAGFTIVGTSSIATAPSTDPEVFTIPVPTGTVVGNLLVVGHHQQEVEITDSRLTPVYGVYSAPNSSGAYGVATDLTDVEVTVNGLRPGIVTVVAVDVGAPDTTYTDVTADYGNLVHTAETGYTAAVAFVCDIEDESDTQVGTGAAWVNRGEVSVFDGDATYYSLRCVTYVGVDPVPELTLVEAGAGGGLRSSFIAYWVGPFDLPILAPLRQRQSPRGNRTRIGQVPLGRARQRFW